jgi:hypothetical protein
MAGNSKRVYSSPVRGTLLEGQLTVQASTVAFHCTVSGAVSKRDVTLRRAADGAIEITGRAKASSPVDVFVGRARGEFARIGSTKTLPSTDPFLQTTTAEASAFAFRTSIEAGTDYLRGRAEVR